MNKLNRIALTIALAIISIFANAQTNEVAEDARRMERTQQSLYIVMAVAITILVGLFLYVWKLDRKITQLEKSKH